MEIFSWVSNEVALAVLGLGLPGLIFLMFYMHVWQVARIQRVNAKERAEDRERYDRDMTEIRQMYINNASLVKKYDNLSDDLMGTITLNTQILTRLVEKVNNNMFCPQVRPANWF